MPKIRRNILVVDDDPSIHELIESTLDPERFTVVHAFDGAEGLEAVRREKPDAVVLDVEMPRMTGHQVVAALRNDPDVSTTLVLMLSSLSGPDHARTGLERGADAYLEKPFSPALLARRIEYLMDLRSAAAGIVGSETGGLVELGRTR